MLFAADIQGLLPHRYPFLLVDRILEVEPGKRAVGIKNVSINEPFFTGHFPGHPVFPGVLLLEAMAQVAGIAVGQLPEYQGKIPLLAGVDGARFRRQVVPGDQVLLDVEITRLRTTVIKAQGTAMVAGDLVAEAELLFALSS